MSNKSEISGKLSALMARKVVDLYWSESASVLITLFIWMQGDAHGVWKYSAMSLSLTDVSSENWSLSEISTNTIFVCVCVSVCVVILGN